MDTLNELFAEGLHRIYYTEQQLLDALEELESTTSEEEIQSAFGEHRAETQEQIDRLKEVFEAIDESPEARPDRIVDAIIEEHEAFVEQDPDQHVLDRYNLASGQTSEHYEIAAYGNLIPMAQQLGFDDAADVLEENLREEQQALEDLSELGEEYDHGQLQTE